MAPKISIIHPSRSRPEQARNTYMNWFNKSDYVNFQYLLTLDDSDPYIDRYESWAPNPIISDNNSAIEAINKAAKVSTGDIFIVISDDFDCPMHWDKLLLDALAGKEDFVVKTQDGGQPWIITLPIMDRAFYNRFGYIYYPGFQHMFADTWMTNVADLLKRKITLPIEFKHNHYSMGGMKKDSINEKNDATWAQGEQLYLDGYKSNFGLVDFPGEINCDEGHKKWMQSKGINI